MPPTLSHQEFSFLATDDLPCWVHHLFHVCKTPVAVLESNLEAIFLDDFAAETASNQALNYSIASQYRPLLKSIGRKLQASRIPHFLKITMYLRICCLVIQQKLNVEHQASIGNLYHTLLQWLWECEPNWWEQCTFTEGCGIQSHNGRVQELLRPLEDFVAQFSEG